MKKLDIGAIIILFLAFSCDGAKDKNASAGQSKDQSDNSSEKIEEKESTSSGDPSDTDNKISSTTENQSLPASEGKDAAYLDQYRSELSGMLNLVQSDLEENSSDFDVDKNSQRMEEIKQKLLEVKTKEKDSEENKKADELLALIAQIQSLLQQLEEAKQALEKATQTPVAPVVSVASTRSLLVGESESFAVNAEDTNGDTLTFSCNTNCTGDININSATGEITWNAESTASHRTVGFLVSDGTHEVEFNITFKSQVYTGSGLDGNYTVTSGSSETINDCFVVKATENQNEIVILAANWDEPVNRKVLLWKMQDSYSYDPDNQQSFADANLPGDAGKYEIATIVSSLADNVSEMRLTTASDVSSVFFSNGSTSSAQLCTVPEYENLTVEAGASITAQAWDGSTGGIIAFYVSKNLTLNGNIEADASGFRGGISINRGYCGNYGARGESHHIDSFGSYGIQNHGVSGGSTNCNGGGAGGGHGASGGIGGATYGGSDAAIDNYDPNSRPDPGHSFTYNSADILSFGGAGASGQADDSDDGNGGAGGGVIYLVVETIQGNGNISADGEAGHSNPADGGGGGGAGGLIVAKANEIYDTNLSCSAVGGGGGDVSGIHKTGPGGGGSGGIITLDGLNSSLCTSDASGGSSGTLLDKTDGSAKWGSEDGAAGIINDI